METLGLDIYIYHTYYTVTSIYYFILLYFYINRHYSVWFNKHASLMTTFVWHFLPVKVSSLVNVTQKRMINRPRNSQKSARNEFVYIIIIYRDILISAKIWILQSKRVLDIRPNQKGSWISDLIKKGPGYRI